MLHSSSPFFDDRVYVELSVNYGYGMNANVTQHTLMLLDIPSIIKKGLELCNISIHAIPIVYAYLDIHSIIRKGLELCNISIHAIPVVYSYLDIHSNNCNKQSSKVERVLSAASACSIFALSV